MKPNITVERFLNSSLLSTTIFIASGVGKTYYDYRTAPKEYKDKFLVKDCVVLSGAALGMLANSALTSKLVKTKQYNKIISKISDKINGSEMKNGVKKSLNYTKEIIQDLVSNFMTIFSGVFGALGFDYILTKTGFEQPEKFEQEPSPQLYDLSKLPIDKIPHPNLSQFNKLKDNKLGNYIDDKVNQITDENAQNIFYTSVGNLPQIGFLTSSMVGAQAIDLSKDNETKEKLKHTTKYLVNDTFVPLTFLSISTSLTTGMKSKYRFPIILGSMFGGTLCTQKLLDNFIKPKVSRIVHQTAE